MNTDALGQSSVDEALSRVAGSLEDQHYLALQKTRFRWILEQVQRRVPKGSRIADVGAAPGHLSLALRYLGYEVTAFDFSPEEDMWEAVDQGSFAKAMRANGITVRQWNVEVENPESVPHENVPYGDFDAIIFTEILEHIYQYPYASVRQIGHLLKKDGLLFLTTPNRGYVGFRLRALVGMSIDTDCARLVDHFPPHMRHVWLYDRRDVEVVLKAAKLDPILSEVKSFHLWTTSCGTRDVLPYWRPNSIKQILKLPLALLLLAVPKLGSSVCVVAQRK